MESWNSTTSKEDLEIEVDVDKDTNFDFPKDHKYYGYQAEIKFKAVDPQILQLLVLVVRLNS